MLLLAICVMFSGVTAVMAADDGRVLKLAPAADAAVVDSLAGFKTFSHQSLTGKYTMPEGLVIRQSYIKDGKIYIPPSGLFYDIRLSNYNTNPFGENVLYILGKQYFWVDFSFKQDVLKDASYTKTGDKVPFGDGTKSLEMTGLSMTSPGYVAPTATFSILKPSGNFYGTTFGVNTDSKLIDLTTGPLDGGTSKVTGSYAAGEQGYNWTEEYYGSSVATTGASYLVAEEVSASKIVVKEFATGAYEWGMFTDVAPRQLLLGVGERSHVKDWVVKVEKISGNSATIKLWNTKTYETVIKELGPLTADTTSRMPADQVQRSQFVVRPSTNDVQVQLDIYRDPFKEEGKVALMAFWDIFKLSNPDAWPLDDRFVFRPDT